jgi:hypothetical protein
MDWTTVLTAASASAVFSAIVTGAVTRRNSERAIQIENITMERAKWRDKIREQALAVHQAAVEKRVTALNELRSGISLNLNPIDEEDNAILDVIGKLAQSEQSNEKELLEFSDRVALLLKHDWERAKQEAKHRRPPRRMTYTEFQKRRNVKPAVAR